MKPLDFMIVGTQKGGTTALASFLSEHPELAIAEGKEVHLFDAQDYSPGWTQEEINARYRCHFPVDIGGLQLADLRLGEATPIYLYWSDIASQLARYNPQLKIIVMLRDPAARAVSHYMMEKQRGNERLPLWLALLLEPVRLAFDLVAGRRRAPDSSHRVHSYAARGCYAAQLAVYRHHFADEQILVLENNELLTRHAETLSSVHKFLGVAPYPSGESRRVFAGSYEKKIDRFSRLFLTLRFVRANRHLKKLLVSMGQRADWPWLG